MTIAILNGLNITTANPVGVGEPIADGVNRIFKAVGIHNASPAPVLTSLHIVKPNAVADGSNRLFTRSIPSGKSDMCPEIIGRGMKTGEQLFIIGNGVSIGYTAYDYNE